MYVVLASLAMLAPPQAQVIDYGNHLINPSQSGSHAAIGWSNDEEFWAWETELNGGGAMAAAERTVISIRGSRTKAYWHWDEGTADPQATWLNTVSAPTFASLGISGSSTGHLIYQFQPSYFLANHKLKPFSQLKTQYTFVLQGTTHHVVLSQEWEPNWTIASPSPNPVRFRRAKAKVTVDGSVIGETEFSDTFGYAIDRIYLSPGRDNIVVSLARFTTVWFEGVNLLAERSALAGRYR